jgi:hypothetical protein
VGALIFTARDRDAGLTDHTERATLLKPHGRVELLSCRGMGVTTIARMSNSDEPPQMVHRDRRHPRARARPQPDLHCTPDTREEARYRQRRMAELELTRTPGDRRLFALDGVGTLRVGGMFSRAATAASGGSSWQLECHGVLRSTIAAADASGAIVGEFKRHAVRRGGTLRWGDDELELRPSSVWRERFALVEGDRELAGIEGKSWGRRPVKITLDDAAAIDPGLLLFAAFVVRRLAEDAAASS